MNTDQTATAQPKSNRKRRRKITKFALAGIGLVGIGAALTSAAWSDEVWFRANASAETVDLQGSVDGTTWLDEGYPGTTSETVPIPIPSTEFEGLVPGTTRYITVYLLNAGTSTLQLVDPPALVWAPTTFATGLTLNPSFSQTELAPNAQATLTLELLVPNDWPDTNLGTTATLTITVTGETVDV